MRSRITIKHLTLAVGILVALVTVLMFLVNDSMPLESKQAITLPSITLPKAVPSLIQAIVKVIF